MLKGEDQEMFQSMKKIDQIIFPNNQIEKSLIISSLDQNIGKQAQLVSSEDSVLLKWDITILKDDNKYILKAFYGQMSKKTGDFVRSKFEQDIVRTLQECQDFLEQVSRFYFTYIEKLQGFELAIIKTDNSFQVELTQNNVKTIYAIQIALESENTELKTFFSNLQSIEPTKLIKAEIIQFIFQKFDQLKEERIIKNEFRRTWIQQRIYR